MKSRRCSGLELYLAENPDSPGARFTYDEGDLEIMTVSVAHELPKEVLVDIARITAKGTGRRSFHAGSTTFKRADIAKGFEPDSCFYFRKIEAIRAKRDQIEPLSGPAPELVVEVDITRSSLNRFPIYAGFGVEEIWQYDGERVRFYALQGSDYREISESAVLSPMTSEQASTFVELYRQVEGNLAWERAEDWVRARV